jgi:hypothetical protein
LEDCRLPLKQVKGAGHRVRQQSWQKLPPSARPAPPSD